MQGGDRAPRAAERSRETPGEPRGERSPRAPSLPLRSLGRRKCAQQSEQDRRPSFSAAPAGPGGRREAAAASINPISQELQLPARQLARVLLCDPDKPLASSEPLCSTRRLQLRFVGYQDRAASEIQNGAR